VVQGIEVHKASSQAKGGLSISVGDVVVMKDDSKEMFWRLAIVEELLTGSDGQARAATVRAGKSGRQGQLFQTSVKHLYPLEVSAERTGIEPNHVEVSTKKTASEPTENVSRYR